MCRLDGYSIGPLLRGELRKRAKMRISISFDENLSDDKSALSGNITTMKLRPGGALSKPGQAVEQVMTTGQGDQDDEGLISWFSPKQLSGFDSIQFKTRCLSGSRLCLWDTAVV